MYAPLFALLTAFCIGSGDFSSHYGLRRVKALPGAFFSTGFQVIVLFIALLVLGRWESTDWRGPAILLIAGILHPGLFYFFLLMAVNRLGPARAITLKGTAPLFGVTLAISFPG